MSSTQTSKPPASQKHRLKPVVRDPETPLYVYVEKSIRKWIDDKLLVPGDQIPTTQELREIFGSINHQTVRKALGALVDEGIINATRGRGTFVATNLIRHHRVCLVFPNFEEEYPLRIGEAAGERLMNGGFDTSWRSSYNRQEQEIDNLRRLPGLRVDGAIIYPMRVGNAAPAVIELQQRRFPFVLVDNVFSGFECDAVLSDEYQGARELTLRLIEMGRKGICWVGHDTPAYRLGRFAGYQDAFAQAGVSLPKRLECLSSANINANSPQHLKATVDHILSYKGQIDAVIAQSDILALKIGGRLRRAGVRIPEDLLLAGFGGLAIARELEPSILTVEQPIEEIGAHASSLLLEKLNNPGQEPRTITLNTHVRIPEAAKC